MWRRLEIPRKHHTLSTKIFMTLAFFMALLVPLTLSGPAVADTGTIHHGQQGKQGQHDHDDHLGPQTWTVLAGNESRNQAIQSMAFLPKDICNWSGFLTACHPTTSTRLQDTVCHVPANL